MTQHKQVYSNIEPLQTGSFSTVYKAWSSKIHDYVALKVIPKEKCPRDIVINEYNIMKALGTSHPNICAMLDFYENEIYYVFVLEYCECGDLYDFLDIAKRQGEPTSPSLIQLDFQTLMKQLFSVLDYSHSIGIAHRDIKPENILMTRDGDIKLADWGLATFQETSKEINVGTDNYRAPETFIVGDGYDSIRSDYWSLGVTIFYIMFGQAPFKCANVLAKETNETTNQDKIPRSMTTCINFEDYLKDPHHFIQKFYFAPTFYANTNQFYSYHNSKPVLYVWRDLLNIHHIQHICQIVSSTLVCIDSKSRSFVKCFELCDNFWQLQVSEANNNNINDINDINSNAFLEDFEKQIKDHMDDEHDEKNAILNDSEAKMLAMWQNNFKNKPEIFSSFRKVNEYCEKVA